MKTLKDFNFSNKRVLVRCDFNVPIQNGEILDDFRIRAALPTINYLKQNRAKLILISHLGRPVPRRHRRYAGTLREQKKYSLEPVAPILEKLLKQEVKFLPECYGKKVKKKVDKMKPGEILLLENLRFEPGEEKNDKDFTGNLAELGEFYVGDAFGVSHRTHASMVNLPRLLPHCAGLLMEREIETLTKVRESSESPRVLIIGGTKFSSKVRAIEELFPWADHLLLGGKIANIILRVKGVCLGKPWPPSEQVEEIKKLNLTDPKLHLPIDVLVSPDPSGELYVREAGPGDVRKEESIYDIGSGTEKKFKYIIQKARTIIWSGPLGMVENQKFRKGTASIAEAIVATPGVFSLAGGGDTLYSLKILNLRDKFSHVSTGGGAMLSFLAGEKLPGITALST